MFHLAEREKGKPSRWDGQRCSVVDGFCELKLMKKEIRDDRDASGSEEE